MSSRDSLLEADKRRRQAMISADTQALLDVLAEDLVWTHSSGASQTRAEFVDAIAAREVVYLALDVSEDRVLEVGDALLHQGVLKGSASRNGQPKELAAKFLAVWKITNKLPRLVAWQSTNRPQE